MRKLKQLDAPLRVRFHAAGIARVLIIPRELLALEEVCQALLQVLQALNFEVLNITNKAQLLK